MLVESCLLLTTSPILKTKGKVKLLPTSISVIEVRPLEIPDPSNIYELDCNTFHLPKGVVPLDVMHYVDHKTPKTLNISILNINNIISSLGKEFTYDNASSSREV